MSACRSEPGRKGLSSSLSDSLSPFIYYQLPLYTGLEAAAWTEGFKPQFAYCGSLFITLGSYLRLVLGFTLEIVLEVEAGFVRFPVMERQQPVGRAAAQTAL